MAPLVSRQLVQCSLRITGKSKVINTHYILSHKGQNVSTTNDHQKKKTCVLCRLDLNKCGFRDARFSFYTASRVYIIVFFCFVAPFCFVVVI
jgi:hypothetical protein